MNFDSLKSNYYLVFAMVFDAKGWFSTVMV